MPMPRTAISAAIILPTGGTGGPATSGSKWALRRRVVRPEGQSAVEERRRIGPFLKLDGRISAAYFGTEVQALIRSRYPTVKAATYALSRVLKKMGAVGKINPTVPIISAKALRQINAFRKISKIWLVRSPGVATSNIS